MDSEENISRNTNLRLIFDVSLEIARWNIKLLFTHTQIAPNFVRTKVWQTQVVFRFKNSRKKRELTISQSWCEREKWRRTRRKHNERERFTVVINCSIVISYFSWAALSHINGEELFEIHEVGIVWDWSDMVFESGFVVLEIERKLRNRGLIKLKTLDLVRSKKN